MTESQPKQATPAPSRQLRPDLLEGIKGVLFDMDGVLLDTERLYTEATRRVLGPEFAARFDWRLKEKMMGRAPAEAAKMLVEATGAPLTPEEYNNRKKPVLLELFRSCLAKPGARDLVQQLASRGLPLVVATSSDRVYFETKTSHHDWFRHFSGVVCGSDAEVKRHKPAPDIFLRAAQVLGVPPADCIVFEDSGAGVDAARAAGARRVIAIVDPHLDRQLVAQADLVIDSYDELYLPAGSAEGVARAP